MAKDVTESAEAGPHTLTGDEPSLHQREGVSAAVSLGLHFPRKGPRPGKNGRYAEVSASLSCSSAVYYGAPSRDLLRRVAGLCPSDGLRCPL